jgi:hypothetical protein
MVSYIKKKDHEFDWTQKIAHACIIIKFDYYRLFAYSIEHALNKVDFENEKVL